MKKYKLLQEYLGGQPGDIIEMIAATPEYLAMLVSMGVIEEVSQVNKK